MHPARLRRLLGSGLLWLAGAIAPEVQGGGSGLNTVVVINQSSSNSCEVANYFCERRGVPPQNVLRINWPTRSNAWSAGDFQTNLLTPLLEMLASRQLTRQVQYVVLSMDIPSQTVNGAAVNGTTSALFYGLRANDGTGLPVVNSYAASEASFEGGQPASATNGAFLATMLTANSVAEAKELVDQGVRSDKTFPVQPVVLAKSSDPARNIRYPQFDNTALNIQLCGASPIVRTNSDSLWGNTPVLGYQTGLAQFGVPAGIFVPGAIADSLTSYGGDLFDPANAQTNLLAFIAAGAAGSYGTVSEPGGDPQKFPNAQVYFYQARGFNLAESYYQSLAVPYLGLVVGEPLAAPFAQGAAGSWTGVVSNAVLSGSVPLAVSFFGRDAGHPLAQVDLFVDGQFYCTLTNLGPCPGNVLTLTLNNYPLSYTVPANATIASIAAEMAALINSPSNVMATRVVALAHGDRVELQSLASNSLASPFYFASPGFPIASNTCRATYVTWPLPPVLTRETWDPGGALRVGLNVPIPMPYTLQASTDLVHWAPVYTNTAGTAPDFLDWAAPQFSHRFYRLVGTVPYTRPQLFLPVSDLGSSLRLHIESPTLLPYVIQASSDLQHWTGTLTNAGGGAMDFSEVPPPAPAARFYRVQVLSPVPGAPVCNVVGAVALGGTMVRVDGALAPYTIEVCTNAGQWTRVFTNASPGGVQTTATSTSGAGNVLSTFLSASSPEFKNIDVQGYYPYALPGAVASNGWVQLNITKTNGATVAVAITNFADLSAPAFAAQMCAAINTNPALQGAAGVAVEDFTLNSAGTPTFNLRARSPGLQAAALSIVTKKYGVNLLPSSPVMLTNNLGDLRPRNHLYVGAGATPLEVEFALDTTTLADGFHELTAVAYEGDSVRTQSRVTIPVQIANSALAATLTLLDLTNSAPVAQSYHIQVAANTDAVSTIRLFSTGGLLGSVTNQPAATFIVEGTYLGVGLHPFYAVVDTSEGKQYRTARQWVRLTNGP